MPLKFNVDDVVYARWPGSTRYYKATVLSYNDGKYEVKFDDDEDSTADVLTKHIMVRRHSV